MGRAGTLQEIREMRFEAILERHERGELTQAEAGELLGMSERSFRRWRDRRVSYITTRSRRLLAPLGQPDQRIELRS